MEKENKTCVQCNRKMTGCNGYEMQIINFCDNPVCPNYALIAMSKEEMSKMDWVEKRKEV